MTPTTSHLDRNGLEVLGASECLDLLASEPIGRLGFVSEGGPVILPVTYVVTHGGVAFRTAAGSKLDTAIMGRPVAFEVDGRDDERRIGWSVLVRGVAQLVEDADRIAELETRDLHPWSAHAEHGAWILVLAEEISGRRLR
jgi:nitroimidazol reductase NimA-like FMN-containing flavoprotein (pyridoxamine 5'-phosphate oxidase superfamily)